MTVAHKPPPGFRGLSVGGAAFGAALSASGALDAGSLDDRAWFAKRIGRGHRIRKPIGPERLLIDPPRGFKPMVLVKQVEPGARLRVPFAWRASEPLLNSEANGATLFHHAIAGADVHVIPERWLP